MRRTIPSVLGLILAALVAHAVAAAPLPPPQPRPRLVVLIAVDQLLPSRVSPELPGGLGRLAREGRVFADAALEHAFTETCPGHATMLTGVHPGRAGIPGNTFFDGKTGETVYCLEHRPSSTDAAALDAAWLAAGVLVPGQTARPSDPRKLRDMLRSPRSLAVDTLGDWLPPSAKVFAVSGKDRSAIAMGGQRPDGVFWLHPVAGFTSSRYYGASLPTWVKGFNGTDPFKDGFLARVPAEWRYAAPPEAMRDDSPGEEPRFSRTSPHPLTKAGDFAGTISQMMRTPWADRVLLEFAQELLVYEKLGQDDAADLLAISLSGTDYIGHTYGPDSAEARVALLDLDQALGAFLSTLLSVVPASKLVVVLTADHGVMPLPEALVATGLAECPDAASGRIDSGPWREALAREVREACATADPQPIADDGGGAFKIAPRVLASCAVTKERLLERLVAVAGAWPGVADVWTAQRILSKNSEPFKTLYRNSFDAEHPGRNADLIVQTKPTCLADTSSEGTNHGSPYAYDRRVPLVFWGAEVGRGTVRGRARTVDIAPTLARVLGITPPAPLDGVALALE